MVMHNVVNECCLHIRKAAELINMNCSQQQSPILPPFTSPAILVELRERGSTWLGYFILPLPVIHRNSALLVAKPKYTGYRGTVKSLPSILFYSFYSHLCSWFWITACLCRILTTIYLVIAPATFHNIKNCWQNVILQCTCL